MHFGIDYGSKLAGTTVITYDKNDTLFQISSKKKEDADLMIVSFIEKMNPTHVYLDAPLSLPNAYFGEGNDYFYRKADKELKAMSPMFLGGLTARAMRLKAIIIGLGVKVFETYPGALIRSVSTLNEVYVKRAKHPSQDLLMVVKNLLVDIQIAEKPKTIHEIDSLLAWYSGHRHQNGLSSEVGDKNEGLIIF